MHIFIDESGNFVIPEQQKSKVSCVTSLTIPDCKLESVNRSFLSLRKYWGYNEEVKGSKLTEKQIADVISILRSNDVLVDIVCLDIGHHTVEGVDKFKNLQADKLIENLTENHYESLINQIHEFRNRLLNLPNQLFIQAILSIGLISRVLSNSTLYYCQRIPEELGNFVWFIDAKNQEAGITPFEDLWSTLLLSFFECNCRMMMLEGGNYNFFKKYEIPSDEISDFQRSLITENDSGGVDLKKIISEQLYFEDSNQNIGLQLVDIVSSAFNRAMNGNLKPKGWRHLGALMVKKPSMQVIDLDKTIKRKIEKRHELILIELWKKVKPMIVE